MTRLRTWLTRHLITDGPTDAGYLDILDGRVRECHADDLSALTEQDLWGLTCALDLAPSRPHEGTAAERTGGAA